MTIYATQDPKAGEVGLGWSEGYSVTQTNSALNAAFDGMAAGDVLRFRGNYAINGQVACSLSSIAIQGMTPGAGLTFSGDGNNNMILLELSGDDVSISDMVFQSLVPEPCKTLIDVYGERFTVERCLLDQDSWQGIALNSGAHDAVVRYNYFRNPVGLAQGRETNSKAYCILLVDGDVRRLHFHHNMIEDLPHETVKTGRASGTVGVSDPIAEYNFVRRIGRDFIDTTGGWTGSDPVSSRAKIRFNTIMNLDIVADIKRGFRELYAAGTLAPKYIDIHGNKIWNVNRSLVVTLSEHDGAWLSTNPADNNYWLDAIPEDVDYFDNIINGDTQPLIKSGLGVKFRDNTIKGGTFTNRVFSEGERVSSSPMTAAISAAIEAHVGGDYSLIYTESGNTTESTADPVPTGPDFAYGPFLASGTAPSPPPTPDRPIEVVTGKALFDTARTPAGTYPATGYGRTAEGTLLTHTAQITVS